MKFIIFLFLLFSLFINRHSNAIIINGIYDQDYYCAQDLILKLSLSNYFSGGLVCVNPIICDDTTDCDLGIVCDSTTFTITSFKLQSKDSSKTILASDISCFIGLESFTLIGANVDSNLLNSLGNTKSIFMDRCVLPAFSTAFNPYISNLTVNLSTQFNSKLKFSYFQYLKNFKIYSADSYYSSIIIYLENDLSNSIKLDSFEVIAANLVSFQLLSVSNLTITLGTQFTSGFHNSFFSTFNNIENLYLKQPVAGLGGRTFPREIISNSNSNLRSFISEVQYLPEVSLIDLSALVNLNTITLLKVGSFHYNYQLPISKLPPSLKSFTFSGGNLTIDNMDFQLFNNINSVSLSTNKIQSSLPIFNGKNISVFDLSINKINNTIDSSWCSTNLIIYNNSLAGTVPSCFSTYFCVASIYSNFLNNQFNPAISNTCGTSAIPTSMKIVGSNTIVSGADLGFGSGFIFSTPSLIWKPLEISSSYYTENYTTPTNFTFTFASSNRPYKLSNSDSFPVISSMYISGTNVSVPSITVMGAYFGNGLSASQLYFDSVACLVVSSSFETIGCRVKDFEQLFSGSSIKITTLKTNGKQIQFMTNLTNLNAQQTFKLCDPNSCGYFNDQGTCQFSGTCLCAPKWKGTYCQYESIYIDSLVPSNQYGGLITIYGWFTNIHNNPLITIGDSPCTLVTITNAQITCMAPPGIGIKTLTITQNESQTAIFTYVYNATCPNGCSGNGNCSSLTGECKCNQAFQSSDCSLPFKQCPTITGLSICNNQKCNNQTGTCSCLSDWTGIGCELPNHYCSSITPAPITGNIQVTLYGFFGNEHKNLGVDIGGKNCPIINYDSLTINCTVAPGQVAGITSVNITQNQISWYAKDRFQYYSVQAQEKECPNACSRNGVCDSKSGICLCNDNYGGFDCSAYSPEDTNEDSSSSSTSTTTSSTPKPTPNPSLPPKSTSSVNNSSSVISISNEQTNFNLLIIQLVELDINGKPVVTYKLKDNWIFNPESSNKTNYQFNQQLNNINNPDGNTWITSKIEEVQKNRIQEFAGTQFLLEKNTIKVSIELVNYTFSNNLNTLQLQIESSIDIFQDYKSSNECNNNGTTNVSESNLADLNLNYLKIIKNSKIMYGRFINTIIASGRSTFITSGIIDQSNDTLVIGLNLPHASNIIVDPDFSVLVDKSYKTSCPTQGETKSWVLPVSIVVPCVTVAILIMAGALIYRKHHIAILLAKDKYKFSLKSLSKKKNDELYLS